MFVLFLICLCKQPLDGWVESVGGPLFQSRACSSSESVIYETAHLAFITTPIRSLSLLIALNMVCVFLFAAKASIFYLQKCTSHIS